MIAFGVRGLGGHPIHNKAPQDTDPVSFHITAFRFRELFRNKAVSTTGTPRHLEDYVIWWTELFTDWTT